MFLRVLAFIDKHKMIWVHACPVFALVMDMVAVRYTSADRLEYQAVRNRTAMIRISSIGQWSNPLPTLVFGAYGCNQSTKELTRDRDPCDGILGPEYSRSVSHVS